MNINSSISKHKELSKAQRCVPSHETLSMLATPQELSDDECAAMASTVTWYRLVAAPGCLETASLALFFFPLCSAFVLRGDMSEKKKGSSFKIMYFNFYLVSHV